MGAMATNIEAKATKLKRGIEVIAERRLLPAAQYRCKSPIVVFFFRASAHQAVTMPSDSE